MVNLLTSRIIIRSSDNLNASKKGIDLPALSKHFLYANLALTVPMVDLFPHQFIYSETGNPQKELVDLDLNMSYLTLVYDTMKFGEYSFILLTYIRFTICTTKALVSLHYQNDPPHTPFFFPSGNQTLHGLGDFYVSSVGHLCSHINETIQ